MNNLNCPICEQQFHIITHIPKIVCIYQFLKHSVCSRCIADEKLPTKNHHGQVIKICPICDSPTIDQQLSELPNHDQILIILQLAEVLNLKLFSPNKVQKDPNGCQLASLGRADEVEKLQENQIQTEMILLKQKYEESLDLLKKMDRKLNELKVGSFNFNKKDSTMNEEEQQDEIMGGREQSETEQIFEKSCNESSNVESIQKNIQQMNKTEPLRKNKTKTSIMIDATVSMGLTLAQISKVLKSAIPRIRQILQKAGSQANFELQLCIYRNYNSIVSQIFKYSNFETNTQYLIDWITPIQASGGWCNEAIEVGFQHINNLQEIDQVIIIGDAKANTTEETKSKRKTCRRVWDNDSTYPFTTYEQEVKKLIERKTKVHSFYLNPSLTKVFFQDLSKRTGGVAEEFDIRSDDRTDKFTNFIAERVLESISEKTGGKDLVSTYRHTHRKTYCN